MNNGQNNVQIEYSNFNFLYCHIRSSPVTDDVESKLVYGKVRVYGECDANGRKFNV